MTLTRIPDPPPSALKWHRIGRDRLESDAGRFDIIMGADGVLAAYDWETGLKVRKSDVAGAVRWCEKRAQKGAQVSR